MKTIRLQDGVELRTLDPKILELVQVRYLDTSERRTEGKHFRVSVEEGEFVFHPMPILGGVYRPHVNALQIEKRDKESWSSVYDTGRMRIGVLHTKEPGDPRLQLKDPSILKESKNEVVFAVFVGWNYELVKTYRFHSVSKRLELLTSFNINGHKRSEKDSLFLIDVVNNLEPFHQYVSRGYEGGRNLESCHLGGKASDGDMIKMLYTVVDRTTGLGVDPVRYYFDTLVWVQGKGFTFPYRFVSSRRYPGATLTNRDSRSLELTIKLYRERSLDSRALRVEWDDVDQIQKPAVP